MDKITIKNLEVFCNHGVYKEENILGQKFLVSAELSLSTRKAGLSDALEDSVSYGDVSRLITAEMKKQNDKLLERAAERIAGQILKEFPLIDSVRIEVKKPWAPVMMHLDYASVSIERGWHRVYVGVGSTWENGRRGLIWRRKRCGLTEITGISGRRRSSRQNRMAIWSRISF